MIIILEIIQYLLELIFKNYKLIFQILNGFLIHKPLENLLDKYQKILMD